MLQALYQLVDTKEKFAAYVNERTRLSFYADFLYPLASDSTLEQYYKETPEGDFTPELEQCRPNCGCTASVPDEADPNVTCCIYSLWYDKRTAGTYDRTNGGVLLSGMVVAYSYESCRTELCCIK